MWMYECTNCGAAKTKGLESWMQHLTEKHALPSEWPSERAAKLTGPLAERPYTTVTESKKKRRKDSIPRPLNSFMIFAQHIRRNVLRVYSDASNSVISQQLGDLWRNMPQEFRDRYDEEANRLVKLHQMEFPCYKYQPKKRPLPGCIQQRQLPQNFVNIDNPDIHFVSGVMPTKMPDRAMTTQRMFTSLHAKHRKQDLPDLVKVVSSKESELITLKQEETKVHTQSIVESAGGYPSNIPLRKTNVQSLSSVLPPLLTPTSKPNTNKEYTFSQGLCDSAYNSGINSSSSSSASSPVVGDLLSPLKQSASGDVSPSRKKIQLVPLRPQSQQVPIIGGLHPTRQRFLSAQNGLNMPKTITDIHLDRQASDKSNLHARSSTISWGVSTVSQPQDLSTVHRLMSPVYLRLESKAIGKNEEVLLKLPPGTTIYQPTSDVTGLKFQVFESQSEQQFKSEHVIFTSATARTNVDSVFYCRPYASNTANQLVNNNCCSPATHSSCLSTSSDETLFSHQCGRHQLENNTILNNDSESAQTSCNEFELHKIQMANQLGLENSKFLMDDPLENATAIYTKCENTNFKLPLVSSSSFENANTISSFGHNELNLLEGDDLPDFDLDENYDTTFDAMMDSIDINTLLPESLTGNEIMLGQTPGFPETNGNRLPIDAACCADTPVVDVQDLLIKLEDDSVIAKELKTDSPFVSQPRSNDLMDCAMESTDVGYLSYTINPALSKHSQLCELDRLEKSSLFSPKPELPFCACE